jgi:hypothetical protein
LARWGRGHGKNGQYTRWRGRCLSADRVSVEVPYHL